MVGQQATEAFAGKKRPHGEESTFELLRQFNLPGTFPGIEMREEGDSIVFEFSGHKPDKNAEALKQFFEFWKLLNEGSDMQAIGGTVVAAEESFNRAAITRLLNARKKVRADLTP